LNLRIARRALGSALVLGVTVLGAGLGANAQTKTSVPKKTSSAATKATTAAPKAAIPADMTAYKAHGFESAPIRLEVFSDFQCPACRELYQQTLRPVMDNYVSAGKVYLIHRDMPLQTHQYSRVAARYANAAARLRKLDRVMDALFGKQEVWSADGSVDAVVASVLTAADMNRVRQMVQNGELEAAIDKDVSLATKYRVMQTPTTVITYKGQSYPVVGVVSYAILKTFLEQLLRQ